MKEYFGKFIIEERIAKGGMAEIYRARVETSDGTQRTVAIKKILPEYSKSEEFVTLLTDEAKLTVTLNHPNIVSVIEFGSVAKDYYLALDYVRGKNLKDLIERAQQLKLTLPLEVCAFITREICQALDYAHRKKDEQGLELNIIHRDVSPTNVLISYLGEVKIVDFGISKAASHTHVTQTGVIRGKIGYMSPEQTKSYLDIDARSDIYSVGILLFEMTTGKKLFPADNINEAVKQVRRGEVPPPSVFRLDLPPFLERVILGALNPDPTERIQSAAVMRDMLNEFLAGSAIKKNYSKIFGSNELGRYVQHLFGEEYAKERESLRRAERDYARGKKPGGLHKFAEKTRERSSESLVTNVGYMRGRRGSESENFWISEGFKDAFSEGLLLRAMSKRVFRFSPLHIYLFAFLMLACVIFLTEFFIKPDLGKKGLMGMGVLTDEVTLGNAAGALGSQLTVISYPQGARIFLNNRETDLVTPTVVKDLSSGVTQEIVLKLAGYEDAHATFEGAGPGLLKLYLRPK